MEDWDTVPAPMAYVLEDVGILLPRREEIEPSEDRAYPVVDSIVSTFEGSHASALAAWRKERFWSAPRRAPCTVKT